MKLKETRRKRKEGWKRVGSSKRKQALRDGGGGGTWLSVPKTSGLGEGGRFGQVLLFVTENYSQVTMLASFTLN